MPSDITVRICTILKGSTEERKGLGMCTFLDIYKVTALWNEEREFAESIRKPQQRRELTKVLAWCRSPYESSFPYFHTEV